MASVGVGSPGTRADGYRSAAVTGGCEQLAGSQEIQKGEGNLRHPCAWAAGYREPNKGIRTWISPIKE